MLTLLTRIMLLQPIFLGLSNIFAAVTQSRNRYALYSISPLLYNVGIIAGVVVLYPIWGNAGLAWGVVLGALLHAAIQLPSIVNDGFFHRLPRIRERAAIMTTVFVSMPRALALSMSEIAELGLIAIAGMLAPGSIAIFVFAYNLQAVPLAIIGSSYSVAAFPTLAAALSRGERDAFINHVATAARYVFFWSVPATGLLVVLRAYMVRVVLGSGRFDWTDTRLTAAVFALLGISLVAQGLSLLLIRAYYAAGRTFVPFLISVGSALLTLLSGIFLLRMFDQELLLQPLETALRISGLPGTNVIALGLAFSLASIAGTSVLVWHFERRFGGFLARVSRAWWQSMVAAACSLAATYLVLVAAGPLDVGSTTGSVFFKGLAGGLTGIIVAGIAYWVLGSEELNDTVLSIYSRYFRHDLKPAEGAALATAAEDQPGQS
jgi:putative peptidoglycan lipid II flippase